MQALKKDLLQSQRWDQKSLRHTLGGRNRLLRGQVSCSVVTAGCGGLAAVPVSRAMLYP